MKREEWRYGSSMSARLPINVDDLLKGGVECERVVFKTYWDQYTTGPQVLWEILAFANDYNNLNGGYVVIGATGGGDGHAVLPPCGLTDDAVEEAQSWIRGNCSRFDPPYQPILSAERYCERLILVIWAPASKGKAHRGPYGGSGVKEDECDSFHRVELASKYIRECEEADRLDAVFVDDFDELEGMNARSHVANMLIDTHIRAGKKNARDLLQHDGAIRSGQDAIEAAFLASRVRDALAAHQFFEAAGDAVGDDPRALLGFAMVKIQLAEGAGNFDRREYLDSARALLERVTQLEASRRQHAAAWQYLANVLSRLRMPDHEVEEARRRARELLPAEPVRSPIQPRDLGR